MSFDSISIIYNPNSTGDGAKNAKALKSSLEKYLPKITIKLHKTKYAGHAEELAYEIAKYASRPLIISSSGDGGYNEVVNGAIKAQNEGAKPICAVLASGNANDHSRTLQNSSLNKSIRYGKTKQIDLLKIKLSKGNDSKERYAHSYIGLGLTPVVAVELNKTDLNAFKELMIVLRTFYKYRPFKIKHNDKVLKLDSIIFANIGEMAKVLTVSKEFKPDDGYFEIVTFKHRQKRKLLARLFKATVTGLEPTKKVKSYKFKAIKKMPAQLDGEVININSYTKVTITSEHKLLTTVV